MNRQLAECYPSGEIFLLLVDGATRDVPGHVEMELRGAPRLTGF